MVYGGPTSSVDNGHTFVEMFERSAGTNANHSGEARNGLVDAHVSHLILGMETPWNFDAIKIWWHGAIAIKDSFSYCDFVERVSLIKIPVLH